MDRLDEAKRAILGFIEAGLPGNFYTRESIVSHLSWRLGFSSATAEEAFVALVSDGLVAFGGELGMVILTNRKAGAA